MEIGVGAVFQWAFQCVAHICIFVCNVHGRLLLFTCTLLILLVSSGSVQNLKSSMDKAVGYLEGRLLNLTNPYAVAMTLYALANENRLDRQLLFKFVSPGFVI